MDFQIGDVVRLRSGGPAMTITGIIGMDHSLDILKVNGYEDGDVTVQYFDSAEKLIKATFKAIVLKKEG